MKKKLVIAFMIIVFAAPMMLKASKSPYIKDNSLDTTFIFKSPRPLVDPQNFNKVIDHLFGFDLLFSESGFGFGTFYHKYITPDIYAFANLYISEARNSDEFKVYDGETNSYRVKDKIHRLYMMPTTFGIQHYVLSDVLADNLKPYLTMGAGPAFIFKNPYSKDFFEAFGDMDTYIRFAGFVGLGADMGTSIKTVMSMSVKYYFIPFGGQGLESIKGQPIETFGGLFLTLSIGIKG